MRKRGKMSRRASRHVFTKGAQRIHKLNEQAASSMFIMRGGIRL